MKILERAESMERLIAGQLRSCIDAHGPITRASIGSATKRVAGAVMGMLKLALPTGKEHDCCQARISDLEKELRTARTKIENLVGQVDHWRTRAKEAEDFFHEEPLAEPS